ncbi:hypothetical protein B0H13DRAFT_2072297 [Mycena leptocephala]|nr:hypothetical protein B0H13DRAFT_2072297 [Mycena leptocephala]
MDPPLNAFRNASALRWLTLARAVHPTVLQLPWTQITSLESSDFSSLSPEEFLTILQYIPNIVKCKIALSKPQSDRLPHVTPLMFLTSLSLITGAPKALDIFDHISVPALQILDLSGIFFSGRELVARLHPILSKSDCRLRELIMVIRFDLFQAREDDFIQLLQTQPMLEKLELHYGSLGLLIAICRCLSDGSAFLPRLGSLIASPYIYPVAEITTTFSMTLDALVDALSTRWVAPPESFAQIRNCILSWKGARTDDLDNIVTAFCLRQKELVALGININMSFSDED